MLADDIETLRLHQRTLVWGRTYDALTRVIAILEPLAGLGDEQVARVVHHLTVEASSTAAFAERTRTSATLAGGSDDYANALRRDADAYAALAASLAALRGQP